MEVPSCDVSYTWCPLSLHLPIWWFWWSQGHKLTEWCHAFYEVKSEMWCRGPKCLLQVEKQSTEEKEPASELFTQLWFYCCGADDGNQGLIPARQTLPHRATCLALSVTYLECWGLLRRILLLFKTCRWALKVGGSRLCGAGTTKQMTVNSD